MVYDYRVGGLLRNSYQRIEREEIRILVPIYSPNSPNVDPRRGTLALGCQILFFYLQKQSLHTGKQKTKLAPGQKKKSNTRYWYLQLIFILLVLPI